MKECNQVYDLRSALERLRSIPGQLVETDVQVDPAAELAGGLPPCGGRRHCHAAYPLGPGHAV